jgi:hypothetical protein
MEVLSNCYPSGMASRKRRRLGTEGELRNEDVQGDRDETGAFMYTFTFRLPFRMGISDNFGQDISRPAEYANAEDAQTFGKPPFVRLPLFNATLSDRKFSPVNVPAAVQHFYRAEYDVGPADDEVAPHLYEQWVSLETPF